MRHYNIPVFIPELACPNRCIYCNQRHISGQAEVVSTDKVVQIIESHLQTFVRPSHVELAFFGGSFTGLEIEQQEKYLEVVQPYIKQGLIEGIRLSTRPDYISVAVLDTLKRYNVKTIELGAQSLCDEILTLCERGHSVRDVEKASSLIKEYGFSLGLQMMLGLPSDTLERSKQTAQKIVSLGADNTRIYPTLVIPNTKLAEMYYRGDYRPLTIEQAIEWSAEVYKIFIQSGVSVLRVGLHPSEGLISGNELIAGPFHVSFRELVLSRIWLERLQSLGKETKCIVVNPKDINYAKGYRLCNIKALKERGVVLNFVQSESQTRDTFSICR